MKLIDVIEILDLSKKETRIYIDAIHSCMREICHTSLAYLPNTQKLSNLSLYSFYPLLFTDYFNFDNLQKIELVKFSHIHFLSLFLLDKIYDEQYISEPLELLVLLELCQSNEKFIGKIKGGNNYYIDTMSGFYKEKYMYKYDNYLNKEEIMKYCYDKYSYAKLALLVYADKSHKIDEKSFENLLKSHDYFAYARQILDDLEDFREDFQKERFNIYNNELFNLGNIDQTYRNPDIILNLLFEAKKYLKLAIRITEKSMSPWISYINFYLKEVDKNILKFTIGKLS